MNAMMLIHTRSPALGTVRNALALRKDVNRFQQKWPAMEDTQTPMPSFQWSDLESHLLDLAGTPEARRLVAANVAALRKSAQWKPAALVLREVLCLTAVLTEPAVEMDAAPEDDDLI